MCRLALAVALATAAASPAWAQVGDSDAPSLDRSLAEIRQLRDQKQWLPALSLIEQTAAKYPDDDALYVLRVHTLSELGARERAWQLYQAKLQLFSAEEAQRIELDRLARMTTASRYFVADESKLRDEAIAADRATTDYLDRAHITPDAMPLRLRYDRLDLLNRLARHQEVVDEYEKLRQEGHEVPGYALVPIGDSLMSLKRPEEAVTVFEQAIKADPDNTELKIQHAYALMESERFDQALPELKALIDANPAWANAPGSRQAHANWKRFDAETNYAMMRSYGNDLAGAQAMLEQLVAMGPNNSGLQSHLGSVYDRRGWNKRALERHRIASTIDPLNVDARIGEVENLLTLQRSDLARPVHDELQATHPENLAVQRNDKRWQLHQGWQGRAFAGTGRSHSKAGDSASPLGQRDGVYGIEVESPLFDDRWRLTAAGVDRFADFAGERVHDRRAAVGLRYAFDRFNLHVQANRAFDDVDDTGASLDVGYRFSDVFDASLSLHRHDPEASLQARASNITADSATIAVDWHPSELTRVAANVQTFRFEDDNRRTAFGADAEQRLLTRPHFLLDGLASVYTSHSSRDDAPYFNPSRDRSWNLGLRADQVVWRSYDRHFRHRLTATAGQYWQEGYGGAWVPALRYEHEWQFALGKVLTYGVSWSRPVYDGQRERHLGFDAEFRWGD